MGQYIKGLFRLLKRLIYQRLNGYDGNGNPSDFTEAQKETLREALRDLAKKLNETAENL